MGFLAVALVAAVGKANSTVAGLLAVFPVIGLVSLSTLWFSSKDANIDKVIIGK
jgi:hypothetical protein